MAESPSSLRRSPRRHLSSFASASLLPTLHSDYERQTVFWLKDEVASRGIEVKSRALKRDLVALLVADDSKRSSVSENKCETIDKSAQHMPTQANVEHLVLWRSPLLTLYHFSLECGIHLQSLMKLLRAYWKQSLAVVLTLVFLLVVQEIDGPHRQTVAQVRKTGMWWLWWIGLGVLSSVGLGTGLHTFLLYLGPHIAAVTLASWSCMSVDFPEPPYPDDIQCPPGSPAEGAVMSIWTIMSKVRVEAIMWGAGTAIGELPPYFMARAARLAGSDMDRELEEALAEADESLPGRMKKFVHNLIRKVGFWGIFICASIPNPLFDLAGITCGHFLVPFGVFFGATLLGKAIVKMHIQKFTVIFMFSKDKVEYLVQLLGSVPVIGKIVQQPFREYLDQQKAKLHHKMGEHVGDGGGLLQRFYALLVVSMLLYFALSIVNSLAQQNAKRTYSANGQPPSVVGKIE